MKMKSTDEKADALRSGYDLEALLKKMRAVNMQDVLIECGRLKKQTPLFRGRGPDGGVIMERIRKLRHSWPVQW